MARERKPLRRLHRTVCFARLLQTSRKTGRTCTLRNGTSEQRGSNPAAAAWRWQDTLRLGRKGPTSGGEGGQLRRAAWRSSKGPCEGETHPHHHTRTTDYPRAQVLTKGKGTRGATGDGSGRGGRALRTHGPTAPPTNAAPLPAEGGGEPGPGGRPPTGRLETTRGRDHHQPHTNNPRAQVLKRV